MSTCCRKILDYTGNDFKPQARKNFCCDLKKLAPSCLYISWIHFSLKIVSSVLKSLIFLTRALLREQPHLFIWPLDPSGEQAFLLSISTMLHSRLCSEVCAHLCCVYLEQSPTMGWLGCSDEHLTLLSCTMEGWTISASLPLCSWTVSGSLEWTRTMLLPLSHPGSLTVL